MNVVNENNFKSNLRFLHIIRGFASFIVVIAHSMWPFWIGGTAFFSKQKFRDVSFFDKLGSIISLCFSNATAMVIVFFVLSGFMISYSYEKNRWNYKNFLINRTLRIYVPVLGSMIFAGCILFYVSKSNSSFFINTPNDDYNTQIALAFQNGLTIKNFLITLLFYRTNTNYFGFNYVYWSLLYEMLFYLLFPLIFRNIKVVFIISIALHPIHFFLDSSNQMPFFPLFFVTQFLFYFSSGVILYNWLKNERNFRLRSIFLSKRSLDLSLYFLFFIAIAFLGLATHRDTTSFIPTTLFACIWIYRLLKYGARENVFSRLFMLMGKISYSLYLIHVPILLLFYCSMNKIFGYTGDNYVSPWVHFVFVFLTLPVAYFFYIAIEEYSIKLIQRHKKKVRKR